jgi:sulfite dehydrogenase (cytochrome) subunit B
MNNWKLAFALAIAMMGLTVSVAVHAQQSSTGASKPGAKADSSQVHRIELPQYPPEIAGGPNVDTYSNNCLICHTARYVLMQPRFPKTVWQSEVKKMVDAYGGVIPEGDQALIVEYLVAVRGVEAPADTATPPK